jgi:hypothetical protein
MRNKDKLVENSVYEPITRLCLCFIDKIQSEDNPYPYKRFQTLTKRVGYRKLLPIVDRAIKESVFETLSTGSAGTYEEISLKKHLEHFINSRKQYEGEIE